MNSLAVPRRQLLLGAFALAIMVAVAYLPSLRNDFVNWDDSIYLVKNHAVHSSSGLREIWSTVELPEHFPNYPLVFTSYWVEYRLWGDTPAGYHATNLVLHAANTALVFALILTLGATPWVAAVTAALFGLHPMQAESVVWIAERKNVLSTLFALITMLAYLRYRRTNGWGWYGLTLAAFAFALLSKTAVAPLPLSLLVAERWRSGRWQVSAITRLLPLLLMAFVAGLVTLHVENLPPDVEPAARPLLAAAVLWFYGGMLLIPWNLSPLYPRWDIALGTPVWWLPLLGLLLVGIALWRWMPPWRVRWGLAHFVLLLMPVLGLRPFGFHKWSFVSNHLVYFASIGFFFVMADALDAWRAKRGRLVTLLVGLALVCWCGVTQQQIITWQDSETLWTEVLIRNPASANAHVNLSDVLLDQGRLDEAAMHLQQALAIAPDNPQAHTNLARALHLRGRFIEAETHLRQALESWKSDHALHKSLAVVLRSQGRLPEAEEELRLAIKLRDLAPYHALLGNVLREQGRDNEAIAEYQYALELEDSSEVRHTLGEAFLAIDDLPNAAAAFAEVVRQHPEWPEAHYNLGVTLQGLGQPGDARRQLETALHLKPDFEMARTALAELPASQTP